MQNTYPLFSIFISRLSFHLLFSSFLSWLVLYFGFLLGFEGLNLRKGVAIDKYVNLMGSCLGFVSLLPFKFRVSSTFVVAL